MKFLAIAVAALVFIPFGVMKAQYNIDSLRREHPKASAVFLNYQARWELASFVESFDYIILDTNDSRLWEFRGEDDVYYVNEVRSVGSGMTSTFQIEREPKGPDFEVSVFNPDGSMADPETALFEEDKVRKGMQVLYCTKINNPRVGLRVKGTVEHKEEHLFFMPMTISGICLDFEWPADTLTYIFNSTEELYDEKYLNMKIGKNVLPLIRWDRNGEDKCTKCFTSRRVNFRPKKQEPFSPSPTRLSNIIVIDMEINQGVSLLKPVTPYFPKSIPSLFTRTPEFVEYNALARYPEVNNWKSIAETPEKKLKYIEDLRNSFDSDIDGSIGEFEDVLESILESTIDTLERAEKITAKINTFRAQNFANKVSIEEALENGDGPHSILYQTLIGGLRSAGITALPIRIYIGDEELDSSIHDTEHFLFGIEVIIKGKTHYAFSYPGAGLNWMPENLGGMPYERILDCEDEDEDFCEEMNPPRERWGVIPKSELWSASISDSLDIKVNSDGTASIIERRTYYNQAALDIERLCRKNSRLLRDSVLVGMHSCNESFAKNVSVRVGSLDKSTMALSVEWKYTVGIGTAGSFLLQDIFSLAPPAHEEGERENPIITYPNVERKRHISISADGATVTTNPVNIVHSTMFGTNSAVAKPTGAGISIDTHHAMVFAQAGKEKAEELHKISNHKATRALQQIIIQR